MLNKAVNRNAVAAEELANANCDQGTDLFANRMFEVSESGDTTKIVDEVGLILAVIKFVDAPTYILVRNALAAGDSTPLNDILVAAGTVPCTKSITVFEVISLSII